jgi:LysR family hydrogen peroxide-inducible transcriptional activator
MVASGAGITLLPRLAVTAPVPESPDVDIIEIAEPTPSRRIAMYWRTSSPLGAFLPHLAEPFRALPPGLVHPITP